MSRLASIFGATTLAAAAAAAVFWYQLHAERTLTAQLQERVMQLEQQPVPVRQVAMPQLPVASTAAVPAPASAAVPTSSQALPPRPDPNVVALSSVALNLGQDPELCKAQKGLLRIQLPQAYPDMAKALGLSAAQSTALTDLLVRQQERSLDMACGSEEARRQPRLSAQAQQAEIEALLGAAKYHEWQEYLPTREGRQRVVQLRNTLSSGETPLTDQQGEVLRDNVLAEGKRRRDEIAALPPATDARSRLDYEEQSINVLEASQNRLVAAAQSYLTASQIAVMKNSMVQQVAMQRALLRARRAQIESGRGQLEWGSAVVPAPTTESR